MGHNQPANEKPDHRNQRRPLKTGQAHDPVSRGASTGIAGSESNQKTARYNKNKALPGDQILPGENRIGQHAGYILHAKRSEGGYGFFRNNYPRLVHKKPGDKPADQNSSYEKQIPAFRFPVVVEKFAFDRYTGCADMSQRGRNAKGFIGQDQQ